VGYHLCFLLETSEEAFRVHEVRREHFDSHVPAQGGLQRLVDDGHAPAAE
jgi:hypothetical protein